MPIYTFKVLQKPTFVATFEAVECDAAGNPKGQAFDLPKGGSETHKGVYPEIEAYLKGTHGVTVDLVSDPRDKLETDPDKGTDVWTFNRPPNTVVVMDRARTMAADTPPKRVPGKL